MLGTDRYRCGVLACLLVGSAACFGSDSSPAASFAWRSGSGFRQARLQVALTGPDGFREVPSSTTGIGFRNALAPIEVASNNNLMNGSGVAAGDFDGDGWCDLYFCAISGTNALYRNVGGWRFEPVTNSPVVGCAGLHSTGAVFADVDADGDADLLVGTLGSGVCCFLNDGAGRFRDGTAEVGLRSDTGSTSLAMADVDGDRDLDLYVANYGAVSLLRSGGKADMRQVNGRWEFIGPIAKRLRIVGGRIEEVGELDVLYLNDGHGHFQPVPWNSEFFLDENGKPKADPTDFGLSVQMRDLNGDRAPEIYVCNDFQTVDRFWINDGRGRFRLLPRLAMRKQSFSSMSVDFGDIDRDGDFDFFVTEMLGRKHLDRTRQLVGMEPYLSQPGRLEGRPEVARNTLYLAQGDGEYSEIAYAAGVHASDWTWQSLFLDVDLDGYEDLLVCNGVMYDVLDRDVLARIRARGRISPDQSRTNLWLYPPFLTPNVAWRNRHDLTFEDVSQRWGFDSTQISQGAALADFDHDGDLDLAVNTLNGPPLLLCNQTAAPRIAVRLRGRPSNAPGIGALIRVSGGPVPLQMQEMLCGGRYVSGDDTIRTFAAGTNGSPLNIEVRWRNGGTSIIRNALAGHIYEVEESGSQSDPPPESPSTNRDPMFEDASDQLNHTHHEEFYPDYALQPLLMKQLSQFGPGVAWFDLDADGREELILGSGRGGTIDVFRRADRGFVKLPGSEDWIVPDDTAGLVGWVWADGRRAVLAGVACYESAPPATNTLVEVALQGAPPRVTLSPVAGVSIAPSSPGPLAAADIDGDGALELFVGGRLVAGHYPESARSVVLRQRSGRFAVDEPNTEAVRDVGMVSGATWGDLNRDGFPELILACDWGPIRVFGNRQGQLHEMTAALGLSGYTGWWNGVATGDFNEDGQLDIVASNWGHNGGYRADPSHPLTLHYVRLTEPDRVDLIESYFAPELNIDVPLRGLNALSQAFPQILERFPTHAAFGQASITNLLAAIPHPTRSVSITTLASTLFLNRGSNFLATPLPLDAQLAPAFHVGIADADGDGHEDILLSQNFFAVRPEWHRMDAGRALLLAGDGRGGFQSVPGRTSGIKVYGEQRGAAWADFDGDRRLDVVITQNGTQTRVFRNRQARPGCRVSVAGPKGNPDALGASLLLRTPAGSARVKPVGGAAGYWSQDGASVLFGQPAEGSTLEVVWPGGRREAHPLPARAEEVQVTESGLL